MKTVPVIIGCLVFGILPCAASPEKKTTPPATAAQPVDVKKEYAAVKGATLFAIGRIDEDAKFSAAELAFQKVLSSPDALAQCQSLIKEGSSAGRLYGLVGLKRLDEKACAAAAPAFKADDAKVEYAVGCLRSEFKVSVIAGIIVSGRIK